MRQIETAYETAQSGGQEQWAAHYQMQLPRAQAIRAAQRAERRTQHSQGRSLTDGQGDRRHEMRFGPQVRQERLNRRHWRWISDCGRGSKEDLFPIVALNLVVRWPTGGLTDG